MPRSSATNTALRKLREARQNLTDYLTLGNNQDIYSTIIELSDSIAIAEAQAKENLKTDVVNNPDDDSLLTYIGRDGSRFIVKKTRSVDINLLKELVGEKVVRQIIIDKEPKINITDIDSQVKLGKLAAKAYGAIKVTGYSCTIEHED